MRDRQAWKRPLLPRLRKGWPAGLIDVGPEQLCEVELGLTLLGLVAPGEPATALWALLTGYPFDRAEGTPWSEEERHLVGVGRHLLLRLKSRHDWLRALEEYARLPEELRGYDVEVGRGCYHRRAVAVAGGRWAAYRAALSAPPPFLSDRLHRAEAGAYLFPTRAGPAGVTIPADLPLPPAPTGHDLAGRPRRARLEVPWDELLGVAAWMDETAEARRLPKEDWRRRLGRVQLELLTGGGFAPADALTIDGTLHLVGMVSSGKSTLMEVLAVWAARRGLRVTLVVPDVMSALRRAKTFRALGAETAAAPVLGGSNRRRHIERLHRMLLADGVASPLLHADSGFDFLSTACTIDGLRDARAPLALEEAPCRELVPQAAAAGAAVGDAEDAEAGEATPANTAPRERRGCPFWADCQRHRAARELVAAPIWLATPASLVYSRVPVELNRERLRYAELVSRRSDLVVVDEADAVQVQLDGTFSPGQTLIGRQPDSWLDNVLQWKDQELARAGRRQFGESGVGAWSAVGDAARIAMNRLYALLRQAPGIQRWIERDYFTEWTLSDQLVRGWTGVGAGEAPRDNPTYRRLRRSFDDYLGDPLGDPGEGDDHPLAALTRQALPATNEGALRRQLRAWLLAQPDVRVADGGLDEAAVRLEFVLLLAVLADRLNVLLRRWKQVEGPLNLEGSSPLLFHRPPEDFAPVVPESPMGNVLGFQYRADPDAPEQMGELRFFRCAGVGRWLLLHLHELFAADGIAGPNVLLLSGTSWAGTSPSYHLQVPVGGVLRAPEDEVDAIGRSTFAFAPLHDAAQRPITVSGRRGEARASALREMLAQLARRGRLPGAPSRLEQERERLPEGRRRILLLVGSYEEARAAHASLVRLRDDWRGGVRHLVADDDASESGWEGGAESLRRGEVDRLAATDAWLLIAPLQAIERGHNILNEDRRAAIGAAYFLVRPHPRPDDLTAAIHAINHWAVEHAGAAGSGGPLDERAQAFRRAAYARWRQLLRLPVVYSTLPAAERDALTWSQLVGLWQVIGRLVRGGCEARVYFCDAAFARETASGAAAGDTGASSLLVNMRRVLRPYFDEAPAGGPAALDRELVRILYGPLYGALARMEGVADAHQTL